MHESIHLKFEYPEVIETKRNMLETEKSMLEVVRHIRSYNSLKKQEFIIKSNIKKNFAHILELIVSIEASIPKEETDFTRDRYKKEIKFREIQKRLHKKVTEQKKNDIEDQISDIQAKLAQLR